VKISRTCQVSFCQIFPLKIRGERGVIEITPFIPPYIKGEIEMESPYSKGNIEGETPCVLERRMLKEFTKKRSSL
jgi:hypothetical protein